MLAISAIIAAQQDHGRQYRRKHADQQQLRPADQQAEPPAEVPDAGNEIAHLPVNPPPGWLTMVVITA